MELAALNAELETFLTDEQVAEDHDSVMNYEDAATSFLPCSNTTDRLKVSSPASRRIPLQPLLRRTHQRPQRGNRRDVNKREAVQRYDKTMRQHKKDRHAEEIAEDALLQADKHSIRLVGNVMHRRILHGGATLTEILKGPLVRKAPVRTTYILGGFPPQLVYGCQVHLSCEQHSRGEDIRRGIAAQSGTDFGKTGGDANVRQT
ncbi:hypothetical protein HPB52_024776 [Rhipicephalus sanguineus]|uniref:Uncharacterized protein n=1 Tax=Rhipicephalus sanguineus TaxID=34632 RepID=A0A9D4YRW6_RHISA|nr:hypothetical protein HPB52_024776 [Rhipicephalus sanguineus]